jgi:glycerophosphoryl diester phosphodiesterase
VLAFSPPGTPRERVLQKLVAMMRAPTALEPNATLFARVPFTRPSSQRAAEGAEVRPVYVVGHRGAPMFHPENTLASLEHALEKDGANGLEVDLCITADGELVLWHDYDPGCLISRMREAGLEPFVAYRPSVPSGRWRKRIGEIGLDEFRAHFGYAKKSIFRRRVDAHIPTLDEFLSWAAEKPQLKIVFFDVKVTAVDVHRIPELARRFEQAIGRHAPRFAMVVGTENLEVHRALKASLPDYLHALDTSMPPGLLLDRKRYSGIGAAIREGNIVATLERPRKTTVAPWATFRAMLENDLRRRAEHMAAAPSKAVQMLAVYTINHADEMQTLLRFSIDAIMSDMPHVLRDVVDRSGVPLR